MEPPQCLEKVLTAHSSHYLPPAKKIDSMRTAAPPSSSSSSSSSSSRRYADASESDSTVLSEIYRTLGRFADEIALDDSVFDHKGSTDEHLTEEECSHFGGIASAIEELLADAATEASPTLTLTDVLNRAHEHALAVGKERDEHLAGYKQAARRRVALNEEKFKLKNSNDVTSKKISALKDVCRNSQALNKTLQERVTKLKEDFHAQLAATRSSMEESLGGILESVGKEEEGLAAVRLGNEALCEKMEAFRAHLAGKKQRLGAMGKTREIEKQLLAARINQYEHVKLSVRDKESGYGEHIKQLLDRKLKVMKQSLQYSEMAQLFEKTLGESQGLCGDFEAKKAALAARAAAARAQNAAYARAQREAEREVERLDRERVQADEEAARLAAQLAEDRERCRQLLAGQKK